MEIHSIFFSATSAFSAVNKILSWNDLDPYFTRARAVKFAEIQALPGPQDHASIFDKDRLGRTHQAGFDVGGRISLRMLVGTRKRNEPVELGKDVMLHAGVRIFVDGHGGRRVGDEKEQQTAGYFTLLDELGHLGRNIDKLRSAVRADG